MKKYIPLAVGAIVLCLNACKKENFSNSDRIVGKWYETKLELQSRNGNTLINDTTFTAETFTKADYFQFTRDNKAVFSQSGIYGFTGKSLATSGGTVDIATAHYTWSVADSTLALNDTDRNPSTEYLSTQIETKQTIVELDANHLVLRNKELGDGPFNLTAISYFTKGN